MLGPVALFRGDPHAPNAAHARVFAPASHNELPMFRTSRHLMRFAETLCMFWLAVCASLNQEHFFGLLINKDLRTPPLRGRGGGLKLKLERQTEPQP